jgi:guanosine-3',5'-bis(diphosphate) 3'-pyrophosphohydrolase
MAKVEDLYASLGYGKFSARQVLQKASPGLLPPDEPAPPPTVPGEIPATISPVERQQQRAAQSDGVIKVKGVDDLLVYRAKCCNPIRGEAIVGYVTRGKGIAVHSKACPNVQNLMYEVERKIDVEWERSADESFPVHIVIRTDDRPGLLAHITSALSDEKTNIRSLEARTEIDSTNDGALVEMTVDVRDKKQLEKLVNALRRISGIRDVERQLS